MFWALPEKGRAFTTRSLPLVGELKHAVQFLTQVFAIVTSMG
jgi:hypothetical protein